MHYAFYSWLDLEDILEMGLYGNKSRYLIINMIINNQTQKVVEINRCKDTYWRNLLFIDNLWNFNCFAWGW